MTPIEKNIFVVDEQGNQYEATYPKRVKGLVKTGRARFVGENTICLACPPNQNLEEHTMSEEKIIDQPAEKLTMNYVLEQIERIVEQTAHLHEAIAALGGIVEIDSCVDVGSGKAQALADVVRCRETTSQKLLTLYEKMYDDLKGKTSLSASFDEIGNWLKTQNPDEYAPAAWAALTEAAKAQLSRHW